MQKTILITGGAGFIGAHFVESIYRTYPDWKILVLDCLSYAGSLMNIPAAIRGSERFEFWYGSVTNPDLVSTLVARSQYVVHFAAESHVARSIFDNRVFFETDVMGTQCVANAVMKSMGNVERFLHISTSEVYGTALEDPMTEDHPLNPRSPYASAKAGADRLVYSYVQTYGIPAVILRPFNQYGPRQHLEKLVPRIITSILDEQEVHIHGDGRQTRDWSYVKDTCANLIKILAVEDFRPLVGSALNLGASESHSVLDLCHMLIGLVGKTPPPLRHLGARPGDVRRHIASTAKFRELIGESERTPIHRGFAETIEWYRQNPDRWADQAWFRMVPTRTADNRIEYH